MQQVMNLHFQKCEIHLKHIFFSYYWQYCKSLFEASWLLCFAENSCI